MIDKRQFAVAIGGFCAFTNLYPVQVLLPELSTALDLTATQGGIACAASTFAVALTAPLIGTISDTFGRKPVILLSLLALALVTLLTAQAASFESLLFWRFLGGLFIPGIFTTVIAYIGEEWDTKGVIETAGIYISGTIAGGFSGRFIAGIVADQWGWPAAFVTLGLIDLLLAVVMYYWLLPSRNFHPGNGLRAAFSAMRSHLSNRQLQQTYAIGFGILFVLVAVFTYVSLLLARPPFSFRPAAIASVFTVYLFAVVATPIAGNAIARFGRGNVIACTTPIGILGMLLTLSPHAGVIIAGLAITTISIFVMQTTATGFISEAAKHNVSSAVGLYTTSYYLGGSLGAIVPSPFWSAWGWPACVAIAISVLITMLLIGLHLWPLSKKITQPQ